MHPVHFCLNMKRVEFSEYGGPAVMRVGDYRMPQPGLNEVQVRVMAAAINPLDWKQRRGDMKLMLGWKFPKGMGSDFAGVVTAVGEGVLELSPGDEVFGTMNVKRPGAFSDVLVTGSNLTAKKPKKLSFAEAACLPIPCATAWAAVLGKAKLARGSRVLINGCTGSVGSMAVQLAQLQGAEVIGTCSPSSMPLARQFGATATYDYADKDSWATAGPFDLIFDTTGTLHVGQAQNILKPKGIFVDINPMAGRVLRGAISSSYKIVFATMGLMHLKDIARLAGDGMLKPVIGLTRPMSKAIETIADLERGLRVPGKTVLINGAW